MCDVIKYYVAIRKDKILVCFNLHGIEGYLFCYVKKVIGRKKIQMISVTCGVYTTREKTILKRHIEL